MPEYWSSPLLILPRLDEYATRFEAHAIDYLLKPFNQERFDKAIQKWREQSAQHKTTSTKELLEAASLSPSQNQRIVVKNGSRIKIIPVQDVFYLEAADDYVKIHTAEGYFLKNKTMNHFTEPDKDLFNHTGHLW